MRAYTHTNTHTHLDQMIKVKPRLYDEQCDGRANNFDPDVEFFTFDLINVAPVWGILTIASYENAI